MMKLFSAECTVVTWIGWNLYWMSCWRNFRRWLLNWHVIDTIGEVLESSQNSCVLTEVKIRFRSTECTVVTWIEWNLYWISCWRNFRRWDIIITIGEVLDSSQNFCMWTEKKMRFCSIEYDVLNDVWWVKSLLNVFPEKLQKIGKNVAVDYDDWVVNLPVGFLYFLSGVHIPSSISATSPFTRSSL